MRREQGKKSRMGSRQRVGAKEQREIKKGYYPRGTLWCAFVCCFVELLCSTLILRPAHTFDTAVPVALAGTKGFK